MNLDLVKFGALKQQQRNYILNNSTFYLLTDVLYFSHIC